MVDKKDLAVGVKLKALRHLTGHHEILIYKGEVVTVSAVWPLSDGGKGAFDTSTKRSNAIQIHFSALDRLELVG